LAGEEGNTGEGEGREGCPGEKRGGEEIHEWKLSKYNVLAYLFLWCGCDAPLIDGGGVRSANGIEEREKQEQESGISHSSGQISSGQASENTNK